MVYERCYFPDRLLGLEEPTEDNELKELAQTTPVATLVNEIAEKLGETNNEAPLSG